MAGELADAFAKHEALYAVQVITHTFGHLRAKPGQEFPGHMIFAHCYSGYTVLLDHEFGDDLDCSPWLHEDTEAFMEKVVDRKLRRGSCDDVRGTVFRFDGKYVVSARTGNGRYVGRVRVLSKRKLRRL